VAVAAVILACRPQEVAASVAASIRVVIMVAGIRTVDIWPEAVSVTDAAACSARAASACSPLARAQPGNTRPINGTSVRHGCHRVHGHTAVAVLPRPRPHSNVTPEGRLASHVARARHVGARHSMDCCVARAVGSCARVPPDCYVIRIVAACRPGGVQSPPRYGIKHGFV
jgi:hypothetical protein